MVLTNRRTERTLCQYFRKVGIFCKTGVKLINFEFQKPLANMNYHALRACLYCLRVWSRCVKIRGMKNSGVADIASI